jgi:uncharacterized NAD(P)/FAD-binding protein YdhS
MKYIITDDQIKRYRLDSYIVPDSLTTIAADEIRSHPLPVSELFDKQKNEIVLQILHRIGEQSEFKDAWKNLANTERNYLCGDIYNIIYSHRTQQIDAVIKELENMRDSTYNDIMGDNAKEAYKIAIALLRRD